MKIRKVKIQAFKSYLKEEDSTFDFSWSEDSTEVADLISIYAPNGFGKTSFYDAVDYCYTSNITRYIRDDNARIQNKKNATRQPFIVRNRNADNQKEKLDTKVVIETEDGERFVSPIIKHSHKGNDYKFIDDNTPEDRKYFRDLMLSQEAIDSFLRETNPVDRFKKFATKQVNELSMLNENRMVISQLISDIEGNVREVKSQESNKETELALISVDEDVLSNINSKIIECNELEENFKPISGAYDISAHKKLRMEIVESIGRNGVIKSEVISSINLLNGFINDFDKLKFSTEGMKVREKELAVLVELLSTLKLATDKSLLIKKYSEDKEKLVLEYSEVNSYYLKSDEFYELFNERNVKVLAEKNKVSLFKSVLIKKSVIEEDVDKIIGSIGLQTGMLDVNEKLYGEADSLYGEVKLKSDELEVVVNRLEEIKLVSSNLKGKVRAYSEVRDILSKVSIENVFEENNLIFNVADLNELHSKYASNIKSVRDLDLELLARNEELEQLKKQEVSVSKLISMGYELLVENESNSCPLCNHIYEDYNKLKLSIESNMAMGTASKIILNNISVINNKKSEVLSSNKALEVDYKIIITKQLDASLSGKQSAESELLLQGNVEKGLHANSLSLNADIHKLREKFSGLSLDSYKEAILLKINDGRADVVSYKERLALLRKNLVEINEKQKDIDFEITKSRGDIDGVELTEFYQAYIKLCGEVFIDLQNGCEFTKSKLKAVLDELLVKVESVTFNIESEKKIVKKFEENIPDNLSHLSNKSVSEMVAENKTFINDAMREVVKYEAIFDGDESENERYWLDLDRSKIDVCNFMVRAEEKLKIVHEVDVNLEVLSKLSEEASSLSESIRLQNDLDLLGIHREELSSLCVLMRKDISAIDDRIESYIDKYFYVDLINDIYNAIDPHPEFKSIKFEYVSNRHPELHIRVKGDSEKDIIAPALHFSSAQINVLSLSIFLAKALKTKMHDGKYANCIFIDDPVQSMDAINVLSIIDLLRNITFRFNKQLIISTHDENFHKLLKKKVPNDLFKSKFLRLESFGKVIEDV